jgi:hypothetical protein
VVHNSYKPWWNPFFDGPRAGGILNIFAKKSKLNLPKAEKLLIKPGGNRAIAKQQAEDMITKIDMKTRSVMDNEIIAIKSHSGEYGGPPPKDFIVHEYDNAVSALMGNEVVIGGEVYTALPTKTNFAVDNPRWDVARKDCIENIFSGSETVTSDSFTSEYTRFYPYQITSGGSIKTVYVEHSLIKYTSPINAPNFVRNVNDVEFNAMGGVLSSVDTAYGKGSVVDLMNLLEQFRLKAVSAPSPIERAAAIAEFEWIHAVTTPSVRGGGTVLMQLDYPLQEAAGFIVKETSYRRIELEALSMTRDNWVKLRVKELMGSELPPN